MAPFYGWSSTTSRLEPLQGDSLFEVHRNSDTDCSKNIGEGHTLVYQTKFLTEFVKKTFSRISPVYTP